MASAPSDPTPVLGRVDSQGRLVAADSELGRLQAEAGSRIGASLALPQLAAVVRIAQRLRIPVSRRVLAAGRDQDIDMWVRALPDGDEIAISIEQWIGTPASPSRLAAIAAVDHEKLASAPFAWAVDEQLRLVSIAPQLAERLSLDPADLAGQPLTKLFRLGEDEQGDMPLLAALASRSNFTGQQVVAREGGEEFVLSGEAAFGPDGVFSGFEGSARASDSASATPGASPLVDAALHIALRSPLDSIVRSAEGMVNHNGTPAGNDYADYAADIATAARHLLSIVRSLGEEGRAAGSQLIDLAELTDEAVALIESAAMERGIAVAIQPVDSFLARAEPRSVIQILVNLIGNAVRYTSKGTAVTVSFERAGGLALLHVADEGPGIAVADQQRIFEPFEQGSSGGGGSGLGLAISKRLARAMGGDVELESTPGQGARFTLSLPAA